MKHTEEFKKMLSERMKGNKHPMFGKLRKDVTERNLKNNPMNIEMNRKKVSEKLKETWRNKSELFKNTPLFKKGEHYSPQTEFKKGHKLGLGKPKSETHKQNLSLVRKGKSNPIHSEQMKGKNNPNWKGGITFEEYSQEFNKELKNMIRKRDNFACQLCKFNEEILKYKLSVHHINYNKKDNRPENLISLCRKCHCKTEYNREYWIEYFNYCKGVIVL